MLLKKSTNNIIHYTIKGYYACNRAVGKHSNKDIYSMHRNFITCKNCLKKLKNHV